MRQAVLADIAHHLQVAIGKRPEIADQIRPPIAAAHHSDFYWFFHVINLISILSRSKHFRQRWPEPHLPALILQRNATGCHNSNNRFSGKRGGRMLSWPDASRSFV